MRALGSVAACFLVLATLAAVAVRPARGQVPTSAVQGAYVVLGQLPDRSGPAAFARVILEPGYACPTVTGGASAIAMAPRDNPHGFPVIVCEASIPLGESLEVDLGNNHTISLPEVASDPETVMVFGDTGCKLQTSAGGSGCPAGQPAQHFQELARHAAQGPAPDLLLHMGDFNYRGTPGGVLFTEYKEGVPSQIQNWTYDAGDGSTASDLCEQAAGSGFSSQSAANSSFPDTWEKWRDDFFAPAREILTAAPWVVARGNHELCSRAGPGWFYFLDPSSNLPEGGGRQRRCPPLGASTNPLDYIVVSDSYLVDLGNLNLVVVDSANACDFFVSPVGVGLYADQFDLVGELVPEEDPTVGTTWYMSHRPIWGVQEYESSDDTSTPCTDPPGAYSCINRTLEAALDATLGTLPGGIELVLSGHMHRFESLTFPSGPTGTGAARPPQIIVGSSGVKLDDRKPAGPFHTTVGGIAKTQVLAVADKIEKNKTEIDAYGYLAITRGIGRKSATWTGNVVNQTLTWAECGSAKAAQGSVCDLAAGVTAVVPSKK